MIRPRGMTSGRQPLRWMVCVRGGQGWGKRGFWVSFVERSGAEQLETLNPVSFRESCGGWLMDLYRR